MQCACATFSSMTCPALQCYSTLSHKRHYFRKKKLSNKKCLFWFSLQLLYDKFLIIKHQSGIWSKIYLGLHVQYTLFLSISMKLDFSREILEKFSNIVKILPVWAESFHTDRQTWWNLIAAFRNFVNVPHKRWHHIPFQFHTYFQCYECTEINTLKCTMGYLLSHILCQCCLTINLVLFICWRCL
jgi:hypothetical protein